jgi:hypothetical protein
MWLSGKIVVLSKYWFDAAGRNLLEPRFKRLQSSKSPNSPGAVQNNCRYEQQFFFFCDEEEKKLFLLPSHFKKTESILSPYFSKVFSSMLF